MEEKLRTLSVLVENEPGVLSQVSRLFSRKGFNIESLAVGPTDNREFARMTIEVIANDNNAEFLCCQLSKMVQVHSVRILSPEHSIRRELVLYKVQAQSRDARNEIIQLANIFRATILDVSKHSLILAVIGDESKTAALEELIMEFGILELARTGIVALERGQYTISDENKQTAEFNLSKSLL